MDQPPIITKAYLKDLNTNSTIPLSIASPTKEITCSQNVKELIPPFTSYVVIPSTPTIFIYNTDQIILGTLPHTKNILVDLSLPFYYQGNQYQEGNYFARYLIYDQRLIGIKVSCATKTAQGKDSQTFKRWPFRKVVNHSLSRNFIEFYKKSGFPQNSYNRIIKVGDFVLTFKNVRICLMFESQFKAVQSLLNDSKQVGADIISIVSDLPRDKMFQSNLRNINYNIVTTLENYLKQYARNSKKIVMYTGCRIAPLTQLYLINPFIQHHQLPEARMQPHFLNKGGNITVLCSIDSNLVQVAPQKLKNFQPMPNLVVEAYLRQIKQSTPGKHKTTYPQNWSFYGQIPEEMQQILKKMHLWYIYNSVNQDQPFICPLPLQSMNQIVFKQLKEIATYISKPLNTFLLFYKQERNCIIAEEQETCGVTIYESFGELLTHQKKQKYFVYTNDPEQLQILNKLVRTNNRIFICQKDIFMEEQAQRNKQIENIEKRMANFAHKVMDLQLFSFKKIYKQNKASPQPLNKDQLRVSIIQHLKPAIRSSYRPIPFFSYIKQLSEKELIRLLDAAQHEVQNQDKKNQGKNNTDIQIQNYNQNSSNGVSLFHFLDLGNSRNKEFLESLESMKKLYRNDRKSAQVQCHRCQKYHVKTVIRDCERCHLKTCLLCFEAIKGQKATPQNIQDCVTCRKLCYCPVCLKKKKKFQKQKQKIQASSQQIKNLSLIHTQKTLEQLQQLKVKQEFEKLSCPICLIEGRDIMYMRIQCATCDNIKCFTCVKALQKGQRQFIQNWRCEACKHSVPEPVAMINEQQQQRVDQERNLSPASAEMPFDKKMNNKKSSQFNKRSPSRSGSPKINRNKNNSSFNNQRKQAPQQQRRNNRRASPSQSKSPQINRNKPRSPSKSQSPKKNGAQDTKSRMRSPQNTSTFKQPIPPKKNNRRKFRSPSDSGSPVVNRQNNKPHSPSHQKSPLRQKNIPQKKKLHSPSRSGSPVKQKSSKVAEQQKNVKRQQPRSPSKSNSNKSVKQQKKQRVRSPSKSGSNKSAKNRNNNSSHSRSRSMSKKNGGQNENDSRPLWGNKNNNHNNYNSNNSYGQRRNNYQDRGQNRNENWKDRNNNNSNDRGGYQKNYGNRGGYHNNSNNGENRYNNRNNDESKNENRERQDLDNKILNIESQPNDNIDY